MRKALLAAALAAIGIGPAVAQVRTIDPNDAARGAPYSAPAGSPAQSAPSADAQHYPDEPVPAEPDTQVRSYPDAQAQAPAQSEPQYEPQTGAPYATDPNGAPVARSEADAAAARGDTFSQSEILSAAEGTFGKGAAGLAGILERTLKEQGRPNAYIAGREGSGAFVLGLRYGKGELFHKIEGQQPIYWTGPSLGIDVGGDAAKVFVLVYNLYDTEQLYRRFPAGEGRLYFVGGFAATYLRRGNIVLIPIRLGVGWRQGVNLGYMKFSHKSRWFPL